MWKQLIEEANKIVIKLGSNTISGADGKVNREPMRDIIGQVCSMIRKRQTGYSRLLGRRNLRRFRISINGAAKGIINYKQALCAIGQVELMNMYKELFGSTEFMWLRSF